MKKGIIHELRYIRIKDSGGTIYKVDENIEFIAINH